jgi:hypothetical protein
MRKYQIMPSFLGEIDRKFKFLMTKKTITSNDLLELKSFIFNEYEKDMIVDIKDLNNMQKRLMLDLYDV